MFRGEIWWAELGDPHGSAPGYTRPVLVVQSAPFNTSRISTVVVAAITSNTALAEAPGNVLIKTRESQLPKDSVVNVSQILTLDKTFLTDRVGKLRSRTMEAVDDGLRMVLDL